MSEFRFTFALLIATCGTLWLAPASSESPPEKDITTRNAYFGDLHVHTAWSLDTYPQVLLTTPEDAFRFASGEAIEHVNGLKIRLSGGPLDFFAVTDHAEYMALGITLETDTESELYDLDFAQRMRSTDKQIRNAAGLEIYKSTLSGEPIPELVTAQVRGAPWRQLVSIADKYNQPKIFTTLIGFEWTSTPDSRNLHRVVLFRNANHLPEYPISSLDTEDPADLWLWMDRLRSAGASLLAIPHNGNLSDGLMFPVTQANGDALSEGYAAQRLRNEPVMEIMQVKGGSETHPALSPNDEWANFGIYEYLLGFSKRGDGGLSQPEGSYVREAWRNGLTLKRDIGINPYVFGVIGSSDTHSTAAPYAEDQYFGSQANIDGTPESRLNVPVKSKDGEPQKRTRRGNPVKTLLRNSAGLAGVWSEENTRDGIFSALERRETFGTSGTRIKVRLFGGWNFTKADSKDPAALAAAGYQRGVTMGSYLPQKPKSSVTPRFLVQASKDPNSAPLQRLQIIKGWLSGGTTHEIIYDVLCANGVVPDSKTQRCPSNNARVDLNDCSYTADTGDSIMQGTWTDPAFSPDEEAFYYVRVLENPTCRWSTWDAIELGLQPPEGVPPTIQERAWSSPIWYSTQKTAHTHEKNIR